MGTFLDALYGAKIHLHYFVGMCTRRPVQRGVQLVCCSECTNCVQPGEIISYFLRLEYMRHDG